MPDNEPLITPAPAEPPDNGECKCTATTPIQVMVPGKFGFIDARLYCDQPAGHPGRHRAETSTGTKHWEGPTRPVGPIGDGIADLARKLAIPEADARTLGEQAEQMVDDQLAVLHAVAERLARIAWRGDNHALSTDPAVANAPWETATDAERNAYLAHALAAAAELVVCGLLAPCLPDPSAEGPPVPPGYRKTRTQVNIGSGPHEVSRDDFAAAMRLLAAGDDVLSLHIEAGRITATYVHPVVRPDSSGDWTARRDTNDPDDYREPLEG